MNDLVVCNRRCKIPGLQLSRYLTGNEAALQKVRDARTMLSRAWADLLRSALPMLRQRSAEIRPGQLVLKQRR